jgi:hypothetical protein
MEQVYDIIIEGQTVHKGVSQEVFFDVMSDLSNAYYKMGFPDPSTISHTTYIKES